jgi:hypothetical protein
MLVICFSGVWGKMKLNILIPASCNRPDEPQASGGGGPCVLCVCVCSGPRVGGWVGGRLLGRRMSGLRGVHAWFARLCKPTFD